jgi:hypothetical protein
MRAVLQIIYCLEDVHIYMGVGRYHSSDVGLIPMREKKARYKGSLKRRQGFELQLLPQILVIYSAMYPRMANAKSELAYHVKFAVDSLLCHNLIYY